jgi:hypothetical protein
VVNMWLLKNEQTLEEWLFEDVDSWQAYVDVHGWIYFSVRYIQRVYFNVQSKTI